MTKEELQNAIKVKDEQIAELQANVQAKDEQIAELQAKKNTDEGNLKVVPSEVYESKNGNSYRFIDKNRSFNIEQSGKLLPEDVLDSEELMEKLIKVGYAGLELVNE